ncbi:type II toxin-antitoxin system HipA family toxin [Microbacterium halotolerans]|uniref:type II toxin-antitoxin system HipA family toxin n=1 Tax=Microbacterium halotolerans TaxID=246613 RepID=UPI000E6AABC9|nr:HipA domain-containing protein [Microbacterium halotolerans]
MISEAADVVRADVYKAGALAAVLERTERGVELRYTDEWVRARGRAIASTLPVTSEPVVSTGGAVPAFFAGLLPEGWRLSALRRAVKTSADDELGLLMAVGSDPVGDVQVVAAGNQPERAPARVETDGRDFGRVSFADVMRSYDIEVDQRALAGVQDKVSLTMLSLPVRAASGEFILKLDPPEYANVVANEAYFLGAAKLARVQAVRAEIVTDAEGAHGLAVQRFDRVVSRAGAQALAVEDGCQVLGLHPEAKYRVSTEDLITALARICAAPAPAALELYRQIVFAYAMGNGDAHAKNFSVVDTGAGYRPSPAYDIPCTLIYGDSTMALRVDGRRDGNISRSRFLALAAAVGIREPAAVRVLDSVADAADAWVEGVGALPFDPGVLQKTKRVMINRQRLLRG